MGLRPGHILVTSQRPSETIAHAHRLISNRGSQNGDGLFFDQPDRGSGGYFLANPLCRVAPAAQIPWGSGIMQIKKAAGFFGKHRCPPPGLDREFRLFRFGGGIGSLLRTNLPPANHMKSTTTKHCLRDTEDHMTVSVITSMRNLLLGDPLANSQKRNWTPMRRGRPPIALGQNPAVRKVFVVHRVSSRLSQS